MHQPGGVCGLTPALARSVSAGMGTATVNSQKPFPWMVPW